MVLLSKPSVFHAATLEDVAIQFDAFARREELLAESVSWLDAAPGGKAAAWHEAAAFIRRTVLITPRPAPPIGERYQLFMDTPGDKAVAPTRQVVVRLADGATFYRRARPMRGDNIKIVWGIWRRLGLSSYGDSKLFKIGPITMRLITSANLYDRAYLDRRGHPKLRIPPGVLK